MATWQEVRHFITENYQYDDMDHGGVRMTFDLGGGRSQAAVISPMKLMTGVDTEEWVLIESAIGDLSQLDLAAALRLAGEKVCGGLAAGSIGESLLVYRHAVPLENLDINEFQRPLQLVLFTADSLERLFAGADAF